MIPNIRDLSNLLTARLSRQVAFWIFVSLIFIEAIILIPSVQRREREMLTQIRQVSSGKVLWIATTYPQVSADHFLAEVKKLQQDPMLQIIQGGTLYRQDGQQVGSFGEPPELPFADAMAGNMMNFEIADQFSSSRDRYDAAWSIPHSDGHYLLILRHDAASVDAEVAAFVFRVAGLVLVISVVVTLTTLAVLGAIVITPILHLRQDLLAAGEAVSTAQPIPTFYSDSAKRRDELGDVIAAFHQMFKQIWQAMSDRKQAEKNLAEANQEIMVLNQKLTAENLRMSAELAVSRKLQQMLLPREQDLAQIPGLEIAGFMEPAAEVGGDYYDVLNHNKNVKISIGDVTGHGLESGVLMLMAQTATRTLLTHNETDSVKFLNTLNQTIYSNVQRMNCDKSLTLTLLDYQDGKVQLSGQHEEVIVVRNDGNIERIDTLHLGFPLGLKSDITDLVTQAHIHLNSGDGIVLYTDGITEAMNEEMECYGLERLCNIVQRHWQQSAQAIQEAVIHNVQQHVGSQVVRDDITLLVLKQK